MGKLKERSLNRKIGKSINRLIVSWLVVVMALSAQADATYEETTTDKTKDADWEVTVAEGCTNAVTVTQTGHKIIKKGTGVLMLNASNSVSGIDIDAGWVYVGATECLGAGTVTIAGQSTGYTGPCGLRFSTSGVTNSANIAVTGNTTMQYPALIINSCTNALKGTITAAQDFMIIDESMWLYKWYESVLGAGNAKWSTHVSAHTMMDFYGAIAVGGKIHLLPEGKYNFHGSVKADHFESYMNGDNSYRLHQAGSDSESYGVITFYGANEINLIEYGWRELAFRGKNSLGGALIRNRNTQAKSGNFRCCTYTNYAAGVIGPYSSKLFASGYNPYNCIDNGYLVITGSTENVETYAIFCGSLALLRLDAANNPDYTMTLMHRANTMVGRVEVDCGTLVLTNGSQFTQASALKVGTRGKLIVATTNVTAFASTLKTLDISGEIAAEADIKVFPTSLSLTTLKLYSAAKLDCTLPETITATYLYVDGMPVSAGTWTHANLPVLPEGVTVTSTSVGSTLAAEVTATWTGAIDDNMSKPGNWLVNGEVPKTIDLTSGKTAVIIGTAGTNMVPDAAGTCVHSIIVSDREANTVNPPFTVGAKGKTLTVVYKLSAYNQAQLRIRGTIATPQHLDQGAAAEYGDYSLYHRSKNLNNGASDVHADTIFSKAGTGWNYNIPLLLDDATIEKPIYLQGSHAGCDLFYALPDTTNILVGAAVLYNDGWQCMAAGAKGVAEFRQSLTGSGRLVARGSGEIRFVGAAVGRNAGFNVEGSAKVVIDTTNAVFGVTAGQNLGVRIGASAGASLEFGRSYGFKSNGQEQLDVTGNQNITVDFGVSTQRFARAQGINTGSKSVMTGKFGSMLEVEGGTGWTASGNAINPMLITMPITGGLGVHYLGSGLAGSQKVIPAGSEDVFTLTNRAFQSCGNLEVSAGTLELAANATWKNGTNFVAKGTGTLAFAAKDQVNGDIAALHLAGSGKVRIPSDFILKVASAETNGVELAIGSYTSETLGDFITGGGTLKVGKKGTTIMLW